jgi:HPt (histidine-containing phosphotransfer) domain-containing protein
MSTDKNTSGDDQDCGVIDWSVLDAFQSIRKPGGPDLRRHIMNVFLNSSPALMDGIRAAFSASDGETLAKAAHSLKSSSMNVGAVKVGAVCKELERIGKTGELGEHTVLLARIQAEYAAVETAFREELGGSGS